jgi:hypothetical protein
MNLTDQQIDQLSTYIASYIQYEKEEYNAEVVDRFMVYQAIEAFLGGAK